MPIYEYECRNCNGSFEKMVSFSEADKLPECPKCLSKETHKLISVAASFATSGSAGGSSSASSCGSRGGFS